MNIMKLKRRFQTDRATIGSLTLLNTKTDSYFTCMTLELSDRNNQINISRIPARLYELNLLGGVNSYRLEVKNVKDRTGILIHVGNFVESLEGCILVGDSITSSLPNEFILENSKSTFENLVNKVVEFGITHIEIEDEVVDYAY